MLMIVFAGLNHLIDTEPTVNLAKVVGCDDVKIFAWENVNDAFVHIPDEPYKLLGFSKGCESTRQLISEALQRAKRLPEEVYIIGPYGSRSYADLPVKTIVFRDWSGANGPDGFKLGGDHMGAKGIMERALAQLANGTPHSV